MVNLDNFTLGRPTELFPRTLQKTLSSAMLSLTCMIYLSQPQGTCTSSCAGLKPYFKHVLKSDLHARRSYQDCATPLGNGTALRNYKTHSYLQASDNHAQRCTLRRHTRNLACTAPCVPPNEAWPTPARSACSCEHDNKRCRRGNHQRDSARCRA